MTTPGHSPARRASDRCIVCGDTGVKHLLDLRAVPVHCNLIWADREGALTAPRGDIVLAYCPQCGHVFNTAFDPAPTSYSQEYENSLHFSPRFQAYAEELADWLVGHHQVRGKDIVELGCGQGDFLALLVGRGGNRGIGFDPSYVPPLKFPDLADRMSIIQDFYSPKFAHHAADLVVCRQVLEHIQAPGEFVRNVRDAVGKRADTVVFFEVPNVMYTLRDRGIWDLIYEHCSYFSQSSLVSVFARNGFDVLSVRGLYGGQFLGVDARIKASGASTVPVMEDTAAVVSRYAEEFAAVYAEKVAFWRRTLEELRRQGKRAVVWGSGSKGVTFLNTLAAGETITHVVDINPRKHGRFVAGTGQEIISPDRLASLKPEIVIIMNSIYREEIGGTLHSLGVHAEIMGA